MKKLQNVFEKVRDRGKKLSRKQEKLEIVNNVQNSAKSNKCEIIVKVDFGDPLLGFTCIYQTITVHFIYGNSVE